jgi:surface antigen
VVKYGRNTVNKYSFLMMGILISACSPTTQYNTSSNTGPKEQIGTLTGIIAGGAIANDLAHGSKNKGAYTVLGAFIGGVMGQNIGSQLDELDRQMAQSAYNRALEYNRTDRSTTWVNPDSGNSGSVTPTRTYKLAGKYCREYTQEITIDGQKQTAYGTACRQPDGSWKLTR